MQTSDTELTQRHKVDTETKEKYLNSHIVLFTWSCIEVAIFKTEWQEEASAFCQQIGIQAAHVTTIFCGTGCSAQNEKMLSH